MWKGLIGVFLFQTSPLCRGQHLLQRIAVEKLIVAHLLNKFNAFYATRMFITIFTGDRQ
jgi:hypothetical protein